MKTRKNAQAVRLFMFLTLITLLTTSIGCSKKNDYNASPSKATGGTPGSNEVFITGSSFSPASLTIAVNKTVNWTNKDAVAHTVTSDSSMFDSGTLAAYDSYNYTYATYSYKFTTKGIFKYHCNYHSLMTGTIIVQ